ncbi:hypothetical protein [Thermomonas paludicola]|uniref:hypothetical protein n=1 Tax=Thermomonas paludicola TaxID=2884874 RepID=UPI0021143501|nr:hypothetical protein [Thermomonas paludicola]
MTASGERKQARAHIVPPVMAGFAAAQQSGGSGHTPECGEAGTRVLFQNLIQNISLWIKLEQVLEVLRKSLTRQKKIHAERVDTRGLPAKVALRGKTGKIVVFLGELRRRRGQQGQHVPGRNRHHH